MGSSTYEIQFDLLIATNNGRGCLDADEASRFVEEIANRRLFETREEPDHPATVMCKLDGDVQIENVSENQARARFEIHAQDDLFPLEYGGIEHLLGVLAGDIRVATYNDLYIEQLKVTRLRPSEDAGRRLLDLFRNGKAKSQDEIRRLFEIPDGQPLFGYNVKPRVGLSPEAFAENAVQAAQGGMHIIEADTRSLEHRDMAAAALLCKRCADAAQSKRRISRFGPNLTVGPVRAAEMYNEFVSNLRCCRTS